MKKSKIGLFLVLMLFVGVCTLLYPSVSQYWNSKTQSRAVVNYQDILAALQPEDYTAYFDAAYAYNENLNSLTSPLNEYNKLDNYEDVLNVSGNGVMGFVTIPKLGVEIPIYHSIRTEVLNIACGHLEGTSLPIGGESTHSVLSAHRGLPHAKLFTDLDKMELGDTFQITILDQVFTYQVDQIKVVRPNEVDDIQIIKGQDLCTLLTCTPYGINSHRLLVRGTRIENAAPVLHVTSNAYKIDSLVATPVVAAPILLGLLIFLMVKYRDKGSKPLIAKEEEEWLKRRIRLLAVALGICLCLMPSAVFAASTTDAKEPIDPTRECSLTISYGYEETVLPGEQVSLYKVADVSANFQYTLTQDFASSGLILNGIQTQGEWNVIRSTLEAFVLANSVEPIAVCSTNAVGQAIFSQLTPGLYLVSAVHTAVDDWILSFDSTLVALPGLGGDGLWQYDVSVTAKPAALPPADSDEEIELKVLKLWRGDEGLTDRPEEVQVEIYRNGTLAQTVVLSEGNQWSYSWKTTADGATWKAVERNVPTGYTMTVEQRENTFVLTNTRSDQPTPKPPQTGDNPNITLYTILMCVSGGMLILLGIMGKRKRDEEDK